MRWFNMMVEILSMKVQHKVDFNIAYGIAIITWIAASDEMIQSVSNKLSNVYKLTYCRIGCKHSRHYL